MSNWNLMTINATLPLLVDPATFRESSWVNQQPSPPNDDLSRPPPRPPSNVRDSALSLPILPTYHDGEYCHGEYGQRGMVNITR